MAGGCRIARPVRTKKYSRKSVASGAKTVKRLFTPEIKKFLKEWLVRRRENPYPNREEKKRLAYETGLTYIQICNWFANWRRKLKNAGDEDRKPWGHLIKIYNCKARGNVEQFSISSDDSIWSEPEEGECRSEVVSGDKYKSHIIEKYLKSLHGGDRDKATIAPVLLSRWLKSATGFHQDGYVPYRSDVPSLYGHGRDEVEAALALTALSNLFRS